MVGSSLSETQSQNMSKKKKKNQEMGILEKSRKEDEIIILTSRDLC